MRHWKRCKKPAGHSLHRSEQLMHDQHVYKQVTKPPVKITYTYMERKSALHLIFIPPRCHSFCSFNGFRQLGWNSGNAVFVCVTETHWGICCKAGEHRSAIHSWPLIFFSVRVFEQNQTAFSIGWRDRGKTPLMWLLSESKNTKAQ